MEKYQRHLTSKTTDMNAQPKVVQRSSIELYNNAVRTTVGYIFAIYSSAFSRIINS